MHAGQNSTLYSYKDRDVLIECVATYYLPITFNELLTSVQSLTTAACLGDLAMCVPSGRHGVDTRGTVPYLTFCAHLSPGIRNSKCCWCRFVNAPAFSAWMDVTR